VSTDLNTPSQRRLQRPADFTGDQLQHLYQIFLRHGLPVAACGVCLLLLPSMQALLGASSAKLLSEPGAYAWGFILIISALLIYARIIDRCLKGSIIAWVLYLLILSAWEEWVFRLAMPYGLQAQGMQLSVAVVIVNLVFGALHYFSLRWKWQWCVLVFFGGLALSHRLHTHFDFASIIAIHWIATYLNTPRPPGLRRRLR